MSLATVSVHTVWLHSRQNPSGCRPVLSVVLQAAWHIPIVQLQPASGDDVDAKGATAAAAAARRTVIIIVDARGGRTQSGPTSGKGVREEYE